MKNTARTGLALALSSAALPLYAQAPVPYTETRPYASLMYSYIPSPNDTTFHYGQGVDIAAGKALSQHWGVEVDAFRDTFDSRGNDRNRAYGEEGAKGNVMYFFSRRPEFSPYFGVGGGAIHGHNYLVNQQDSAGIVDVGLGFMKFFNIGSTELGFRADARYRWTFLESNSQLDAGIRLNNPVVKVGLVAPLGPKPVALAEPPVIVEQYVPPPPMVDVDTDGDGVVDRLDQCPGTPLGTPVDARGCPLPVAPIAQPSAMSYCNQHLEPVYFAFDRSELTPAARATLNRNVVKINELAASGRCTDSVVDLEGNTDSVGTEAYNQALSERRANVVRGFMEGKVRVRLRTVANGENRPVATNDTDEGRAQNRRTEVQTRGTQR